MNAQNQDQTKKALLEITVKALKDESYKKRLEANPVEAIKEVFPDFSTDAKIVVQDQTDSNVVYLNISPFAAASLYESIEELELNEAELELISGGAAADNNYGLCNIKFNWTCGIVSF